MTHYRMQDSEPSAIILAKNPRTSSLDELKSYQGNTIYLNNGDEFQIRLFNPLREKIGVQIGINGDISQSLLVLNPGEDVTLDRFLDDKSKMLYETYTIDGNNQAAVNAAASNGIVNVNFFKEKKVVRPNRPHHRLKSAKSSGVYGASAGGTTRGIDDGTTFTTNIGSDYATLGNTNGMENITLTSSNNVFFSQSLEGDVTLDGALSDKAYVDSPLDFASDPIPEVKKETGRVEKGNESAQHFNEVQVEFETFSFYQVTYYLKPTSERGATTVTETKVRDYCPECGYRIRNTRWNFCPKCGDEV